MRPACCGRLGTDKTPLAHFADALKSESRGTSRQLLATGRIPVTFPMYVILTDVLFKMTKFKKHEELKAEGGLVLFTSDLGNAIFVSHEWAGEAHPDPTGEQLKVLQAALKALLFDATSIPVDINSEILFGKQPGVFTSEMRARPLFVWYDYCSCPQAGAVHIMEEQQKAIDSIPAYVESCKYFFILCPQIRHSKKDLLLSKSSWGMRGWCRLERLASQLKLHGASCLIEVRSGKHQTLTVPYEYLREPVFEGVFTLDADRARIVGVVQSLIRNRLLSYLVAGDFHNYRMLLNLQHVHFRSGPVEPIRGLVPGFRSQELDPSKFFLDEYLHEAGFEDGKRRVESGWTPLCYAALGGNPLIISALLELQASPNDTIHKGEKPLALTAGTSVLTIAVVLRHSEAMRVLLEHRADVNARDKTGSTAMHYACASKNMDAVDILRAAGGSTTIQNSLHFSPLALSGGAGAGEGSVDVIRALLQDAPRAEVSRALHSSILFGAASAEVVAALIEADADIDQPLAFPPRSPISVAFAVLSAMHLWRATPTSMYAYHHSGATPLMCSILCGSFEAAAVLIAAGARVDIRNRRGKTPADLAELLSAPEFIISGIQGKVRICEDLVLNCFTTQSVAF